MGGGGFKGEVKYGAENAFGTRKPEKREGEPKKNRSKWAFAWKKKKKPILKSWLRPIRVRKKSLDTFFSQSSFIGGGN